jgi:site-specific recombinase XerD
MKKLIPITICKETHRDAKVFMLYFEKNAEIISLIKKNRGTWSLSKKGWYFPQTPFILHHLLSLFKGKAWLTFDWKKKAAQTTELKIVKAERKPRVISEKNKQTIREYVKYLKGKRLSESTVAVYFTFVADFINYIKDKELSELTNRDVELFLEDVFLPRKMSISSQRQFISAIKHFVVFYPDCAISGIVLERPRRDRFLPTVLSQEEVIDLIRSCKNLKHRAIITLLYSSGLRVGELLNLKLIDINIDRKQIYINNGKGRKDRYVQLAKSFLPLLQNYFVTYKPEHYFVEGPNGLKYSASSVRKFLHRASKDAEISKKVTPHTLRHSYATHMLENGIGLRHIQELLGHSKPETTMIYTHVAKKDLLDIESPLDNIIINLKKTNKEEHKFLLSGNKTPKRGL